jgi:hypothetical protein
MLGKEFLSGACRLTQSAVVAQLVRASACHAEGRGFKSHSLRNLVNEKTMRIALFFRITKRSEWDLTRGRETMFECEVRSTSTENICFVTKSHSLRIIKKPLN